MTNEEAIGIIKNYDIYSCGYCHQGGDKVKEAFEMAIEALEQKATLDKIRAEIEQMPTDYCGGYIGLDKREILSIIDKYKAESEGRVRNE